jgi:hypothetical protein
MSRMTRPLLAVLPLCAVLSVTVAGPAVGSVPARAHAARRTHHTRKRCKRGTVRVRHKGSKRVSCVTVGKLPRGAAPVAGLQEMRAMLTGVPLRARRHRRAGHRPKTLGRLMAADHVNPAVLQRMLGRTASRLPVALAATRAHAADMFPGPTVDGWTTSVDTGGDDSGTVTVTAKKDGATMSMGYSDDVKLDTCPDAQGDVRGSRILELTFDVEAKDESQGRAKIHFDAKSTAKFVGHVTDDLKVRDYDVDPFTMYEYVRGEVYDASGTLVLSTPPFLPNISGGVRGLTLGHTSPDDLNRGGNKLSGTAPSEMSSAGLAAFLKWSQYEFYRSVRAADTRLTDAQTRGWPSCLDVSVSAAKTTLAPGESTTLTITVAPQHGPGFAPARLTGSGGSGMVAPAGATTAGQPVQVTFTAPSSGWTGTTAYFTATSRQGHGYGDIALAATPPRNYVLVFSHASQLDDTHDVDNPSFVGTSTHHEAFDLTARIPLSGDPTAGTVVTGSGPIAYTRAEYHDEQDGTFHGQGTCIGTDRTDLTAAHGGTARVLGVRVSGGSVTLDFAPGAFSSSADGPPSESYHNVQKYDVCPDADNTSEQALFLNTFRNQYDSAGWVFGTNQYAHLTTGWKPGSGDVVATLDVTGLQNGQPGSSYTDHYEIDRVP